MCEKQSGVTTIHSKISFRVHWEQGVDGERAEGRAEVVILCKLCPLVENIYSAAQESDLNISILNTSTYSTLYIILWYTFCTKIAIAQYRWKYRPNPPVFQVSVDEKVFRLQTLSRFPILASVLAIMSSGGWETDVDKRQWGKSASYHQGLYEKVKHTFYSNIPSRSAFNSQRVIRSRVTELTEV